MIVRSIAHGRMKAIDIIAKEVVKRAQKFPDQLFALNRAVDQPSVLELETRIKKMIYSLYLSIKIIN